MKPKLTKWGGVLSLGIFIFLITYRRIKQHAQTTNTHSANTDISIINNPTKTTNFPKQTKLVFNYAKYTTTPDEFKTWIDILFNTIRLPDYITAMVIGLLVFLGGLTIAWSINFELEYLTTTAIYIGTFGITWVLGVFRYGSKKVHSAYAELRPCFLIKDETYRQKIYYWFNKLKSHWANLLTSTILFTASCIAVYIAFFQPDISSLFNINSLRPFVFKSTWYTPEYLSIKAFIVAYYGFFVSLALGSSFRTLVTNVRFLFDLRHIPVIPSPNIIRTRLRKTTDFYVFIAGTWFVGVSLFGFAFFKTFDPFSIMFMGGLSVIGLLTFLVPQFIFRRYLLRSYRLTCDWALTSLNKRINIELIESDDKDKPEWLNAETANIENIDDLMGATDRPHLWVYDPEDFVVITIGQLVAIISVFYQNIIQSIITK